jgi:hypothetical protein
MLYQFCHNTIVFKVVELLARTMCNAPQHSNHKIHYSVSLMSQMSNSMQTEHPLQENVVDLVANLHISSLNRSFDTLFFSNMIIGC